MLLLIVLFGAFLRFYNLMWGDGNFFHPDEGNMARSISQMTIEKGLHPDFFAYGQFPLYIAYFVTQLLYFAGSFVTEKDPLGHFPFYQVNYNDAIFSLRFFASFLSTLTIPLVYLIIKEIAQKDHRGNQNTGIKQYFSFSANDNCYPLLGTILVACLPGLIQSAHFGTTESALTFVYMLVLYLSIRLLRLQKNLFLWIVAIGSVIGIGLGTKISAVFFFVPAFLGIVLSTPTTKHRSFVRLAFTKLLYMCVVVVVAVEFFALSSPYSLVDWEHFYGTSYYESRVAMGEVSVFYTRQFIQTTPLLFQLARVFPPVLGLGLFSAGLASFFALPLLVGKVGTRLLRKQYIVLVVSFLFVLIPNGVLFVKWTRFLTPTFPFFALFTTLAFYLVERIGIQARFVRVSFLIVTIFTVLSGFSFASIYMKDDVRKTASYWIYKTIPQGSYILSETGNVVDIPLHIEEGEDKPALHTGRFGYTVISFDFYGLDENPKLPDELAGHLVKADYIFIPSRRIFTNHMRVPLKFPITNRYYEALFDGRLGFEKVSEFSSYPSILGFNLPDESAEETWTVFDHPVVRIYQKKQSYTFEEYQAILKPENPL